MNPIIEGILKDAMASLPAGLPEEVAEFLGTAMAHALETVWAKHLADPSFGPKMTAWSAQAQAAQGGTDDDKAKASADLFQLMGE